jgi:hypothetical protein
VRVESLVLTPRAWALRLNAGPIRLARTGPLDVLVDHDGRESRVYVPDVTRIAQLALLGLALVVALACRPRTSVRKEHTA